jgi:xanthine dehydrogenase YagS FAD-binding subunit
VIRPTTLEEAARVDGEYRAGGTDLLARRRLGLHSGVVVDLTRIPGLVGVEQLDDGVRIGALTRIADVATAPIIAGSYPALASTAGSLATPQIRAAGTVGGNLLQRNRCPYYRHPHFSCFKSGGDSCPARFGDHSHGVVFDLGPCVSPHPSSIGAALLTYDAEVDVTGRGRIPVAEVFGDGSDGQRDHQLGPGEVLVAIHLPAPWEGERAAYQRVTSRALAEWPIVEAVCRLTLDDGGRISRAGVAVGGVAPVPLRSRAVEEALVGVAASDRSAIEEAAREVADGADPLPQTGHKVPLLIALVADVIESAANHEPTTEAGLAERGLPTKSGPL